MKPIINQPIQTFYATLLEQAQLIEEKVFGENEEGELIAFFGLDDAEEEADIEGVELEEFGEAYYHLNGQMYYATISLDARETTDILQLETEEVQKLIDRVIHHEGSYDGDADLFYQDHSWALN